MGELDAAEHVLEEISRDATKNPIEVARRRVLAGRVGWVRPLVAVFLLPALAFVAIEAITLGLALAGATKPWDVAGQWWSAWVPLLYLPTLAVLVALVHQEGDGVGSLIGVGRTRVARHLLTGAGLGVSFFVSDQLLAALFGQALVWMSAGHTSAVVPPPFGVPQQLPLPAAVSGVVILPLLSGTIEELIYRGYALPRLAALGGWLLAIVIVSFGFGLEHALLWLWRAWPLAVGQGLAFFVIGVAKALLFRWHRHLLPLIVGHTLWGFIGIGLLASLLPYLLGRI